jgi:hypothetical protein
LTGDVTELTDLGELSRDGVPEFRDGTFDHCDVRDVGW